MITQDNFVKLQYLLKDYNAALVHEDGKWIIVSKSQDKNRCTIWQIGPDTMAFDEDINIAIKKAMVYYND